ncbi:hypothetical protein [Flammeovirga kamogawensis]|uniref:DUF4625 domain-containing protein n=1 Tax=Flammeovirga kamogawensis TaxID=373891 RepID=A0ABX8H529_9BACT|nr:hypothetical protein [Flammeovirga kamogawensis]MBB6461823.1 hypothetical protein [Flammeovirga kamogawensis]QWG10739.1 hypothetical protein KM029_25480 [Flammeovirga kamogawensis]TRX63841.1 hypothetical protein EO216_25850 [Flammeovirga kamogawensis]
MNKNIFSILILTLLGLSTISCHKNDEAVLSLGPELEIINHKDIIKVTPYDTIEVSLHAFALGDYELSEVNNDDRYLSKIGHTSNSNGKVTNATYKFLAEEKKGTYDYVFTVRTSTGVIEKVTQKVEVVVDASSIVIDKESYNKEFSAGDKVVLTGTISTVKELSEITFSTNITKTLINAVSQNAVVKKNETNKYIKLLESEVLDTDENGVRTFSFKIEITIPDIDQLNKELKLKYEQFKKLKINVGPIHYYEGFSLKIRYSDENTVYYHNKGNHDLSKNWEHKFDIK